MPRFQRWGTSGASAPIIGALWMVLACLAFASMWAFARVAGTYAHPFVTVFYRFLFGFVLMLPWLLRVGRAGFATRRVWLHLTNAFFQVLATAAVFYGVTVIAMAETAALSFTAPLFATAGAALVLGERVGIRRWSALVVGFAGALLILRPGTQAIDFASLIVLGGAACAASGTLCTKALSRTDSPNTIVVWLSFTMTLMALPAALPHFEVPNIWLLASSAGAGAMGTLGLLSLVRSYRAADASAVLPFRFFQLVFVAFYGFILFGETPDSLTWMGSIVIFAATVYTARREAIRARAERAAAQGAAAADTVPAPTAIPAASQAPLAPLAPLDRKPPP